jgi:hypothetical protein
MRRIIEMTRANTKEKVSLRLMGAPESCCACPNLFLNEERIPFCNLPDKPNAKCSGEGSLEYWAKKTVSTEELQKVVEGLKRYPGDED